MSDREVSRWQHHRMPLNYNSFQKVRNDYVYCLDALYERELNIDDVTTLTPGDFQVVH